MAAVVEPVLEEAVRTRTIIVRTGLDEANAPKIPVIWDQIAVKVVKPLLPLPLQDLQQQLQQPQDLQQPRRQLQSRQQRQLQRRLLQQQKHHVKTLILIVNHGRQEENAQTTPHICSHIAAKVAAFQIVLTKTLTAVDGQTMGTVPEHIATS